MLKMIFVRFFPLFSLALLCVGFSLFAHPQNVFAAGGTPAVTLTVNGSVGPVAVPSGSRLEIRWSATGAVACAGDWTASALKTSGAQFGRITKSRLFTVVCSDGKGRSAKKSVTVSFITQRPLRTDAEWPAVTVMSPNGNEIWTQGEGRTLAWTANDVPILKNGFIIDLVSDRDASYSIASSSLAGIARNFFWLIPQSLPAGKYKVRVTIQNETLSDMSDGFFTVMKAYVGPSKALICGTLGDVTGDKVISSADADRIAVFAANPRMMSPDDFKRADIDVNGVIAPADSVQVNQYLTDTIKTFSGCLVPGVSVDLRANGSSSSLVSVPISSTVTLSWTSSGAGRCLLDEAAVPTNGSAFKSASSFSSTVYTIHCFGAGNSQRVSDDVTVVVESPNKMPAISTVDAPASLRAGISSFWSVTASDPDGTELTITANWEDGKQDTVTASTTILGGNMFSPFSHTFAKEGTHTVSFTAKDQRGGEIVRTFPVVVTESPRIMRVQGRYQFAALFEGYRGVLPVVSNPPAFAHFVTF